MSTRKNEKRMSDEEKNSLLNEIVEEQAEESEKIKAPSKAKTKDQSDFLKLNLRPKNGKDYKAYVIKMANKQSEKTGEQVNMTTYIQGLIDYDMQRTSGKLSKREKVIDLLTKLSDKQLDGLAMLLSDM